MKISSIAQVAHAVGNAQTVADQAKKVKLHKAATEFESLMVKQMLTSAHVLGKEKGGYADMAMDALANGVTAGGGIGLAKKVEDIVNQAEISGNSPAKPPTKI